MAVQQRLPIQITDTLFQSGVSGRSHAELGAYAIEVVVSVMEPSERESFAPADYDIDLADTAHADLLGAIRKLLIIRRREKGRRMLVHCNAGLSRSVALVMGVLMHEEGLSYAMACKRIGTALVDDMNPAFKTLLATDWTISDV